MLLPRGDVATLGDGDFFGEMALLRAEPRSATISANGLLKCLTLNRITFTRLLGPLQERLALEIDRRELQGLLASICVQGVGTAPEKEDIISRAAGGVVDVRGGHAAKSA